MTPIRAASADTSAFAYSRFRDDDLQYLFAVLETAIKFVQADHDATLDNATNFDGSTWFDYDKATEDVFEVASVLHGLKVASDKVSDAITGYDDADESQADEAEDPACDEDEDAPQVLSSLEWTAGDLTEMPGDRVARANARLMNAQAALLEQQVEQCTPPLDNGVAMDLGELGWLNVIGDEKLVDFIVPRIREALGNYSASKDADAHPVAPLSQLQEALRGLPRTRRDAILKAVHGRGEAN